MLKLRISKEDHAALPDDLKKEYKASGDDFVLDLDGYEDPGELRRARDREKQAAKDAKEELERLKREAEEAKTTGARASGDIATLEKSWQDKLKAKEDELKGKLTKREQWARKQLVHSVAEQLAKDLSDAPTVLLPHILQRLDADLSGDDPATIVLDKDGKRSALTPAELAAEFRASSDFAAIIRGSKATGAGGGGGRSGGATKKPNEMTTAERIQLNKENPAEFQRLFGVEV